MWWVQDQRAPLWTGAVTVFDGAPLRVGPSPGARSSRRRPVDIDLLRHHVDAALDAHPRFRQRIEDLPLGRGVRWTDEDGFAIDDHVHLVDVAPPGGDAELDAFVDDLLERPLPADRSPWDIWVVDGLRRGRVAVILQVNHVLADGTALIELALSLLSLAPDGPSGDAGPAAEPSRDSHRSPSSPTPGRLPLMAAGVAARARNQVTALGRLAVALADPQTVVSAGRAVARLGRGGPPVAPATSLTRPVGRRRPQVRPTHPREARAAGGPHHRAPLHDVLIAVLTGAVARYLERDGGPPARRPPRVLVPVSQHRPGEPTANSFGFYVTELPVATADPVDRLHRIHVEMDHRKRSPQGELTQLVFSIADFVPPPMLQAAAPTALRHQPFVNLVLTNMPGSPDPLYLLGARMRSVHPFVCGIGNMAAVIGVLSYGDDIGVGITVDLDAVPDAEALAADMEVAATELIDSVDGRARST